MVWIKIISTTFILCAIKAVGDEKTEISWLLTVMFGAVYWHKYCTELNNLIDSEFCCNVRDIPWSAINSPLLSYFRYSKNGKEMDASELLQFIQKEQKCKDFTVEECNTLIETFEQSELKETGKISLIGRWQLKKHKCLWVPLEHQVSLFCSGCQYKP